MGYENIALRKRNFTMINGYFYMIDENQDAMIVKTDDGTQAYSYPLGTALSTEVRSLEYDGRNFWTLENPGSNTIRIRRWYINNYALEQRNLYTLDPGSTSINWDSFAFTVEHYHVEFGGNESAGSTNLSVDTGGTFDLDDKLSSGMTVTLGPNATGQIEEKTVNSVGADFVNINGTTSYAYQTGDPITFYTKLWIFNDYVGTTAGGALYSANPYVSVSPSFATLRGTAGAYQDVQSCTFFDLSNSPVFSGDKNTIAYVKATNMIFLDPANLSNSFGSMVMDNLKADQTSTITIYDVTIEGTNVYRLQQEATYYGSAHGPWSSYNYQLSTLNPFITSISLKAEPAILPANLTNTSTVTAVVKDQFNQAISGKLVYFTEDDPNGSIISANPDTTDANGEATAVYQAGSTAREVKITATAQQS